MWIEHDQRMWQIDERELALTCGNSLPNRYRRKCLSWSMQTMCDDPSALERKRVQNAAARVGRKSELDPARRYRLWGLARLEQMAQDERSQIGKDLVIRPVKTNDQS